MNIIKKFRKLAKKLPFAKKDTYVKQFDLEAEEVRFEKFCKQTSRTKPNNLTNYSQWEGQIKQRINNTFKTEGDLYNFKRHCEIKAASLTSDSSISANLLLIIATVAITFFFGEMVSEISAGRVYFLAGMLTMSFIVVLATTLLKNDSSEILFYNHLIRIIETCEKEAETASKAPKLKNQNVLETVQNCSKCRADTSNTSAAVNNVRAEVDVKDENISASAYASVSINCSVPNSGTASAIADVTAVTNPENNGRSEISPCNASNTSSTSN